MKLNWKIIQSNELNGNKLIHKEQKGKELDKLIT